jgi:hypothetical protein
LRRDSVPSRKEEERRMIMRRRDKKEGQTAGA